MAGLGVAVEIPVLVMVLVIATGYARINTISLTFKCLTKPVFVLSIFIKNSY